MNIIKKKEPLTARQPQLIQLKQELKDCERMLKQTEMMFHMTVDEHLIEARIYELKSLAKVQDHLISSIRQLMSCPSETVQSETVNV